jgi:hypothetical protein
VEAAPEADHLELLRAGTGEPERGLDRLRAAREELRAPDRARSELGEQLEEPDARLRGEAADRESLELPRQGGDEARMRVTEARDRDAGEEVEVLLAVDVGQRAAPTLGERELRELRDPLDAGRDHRALGFVERARPRPRDRSRRGFRATSAAPLL